VQSTSGPAWLGRAGRWAHILNASNVSGSGLLFAQLSWATSRAANSSLLRPNHRSCLACNAAFLALFSGQIGVPGRAGYASMFCVPGLAASRRHHRRDRASTVIRPLLGLRAREFPVGLSSPRKTQCPLFELQLNPECVPDVDACCGLGSNKSLSCVGERPSRLRALAVAGIKIAQRIPSISGESVFRSRLFLGNTALAKVGPWPARYGHQFCF